MVFSKSEFHQRKLRQSANDTNKHGKFAKLAHSRHSRSKNGGLSNDNEKTIVAETYQIFTPSLRFGGFAMVACDRSQKTVRFFC